MWFTSLLLLVSACRTGNGFSSRAACAVIPGSSIDEGSMRSLMNINTRLLDHTNDAEFVAAVAIRAAAFMDEGQLRGPNSREAFDRKLRKIFELMRSRQNEGSDFVIAVASLDDAAAATAAAAAGLPRPWELPSDWGTDAKMAEITPAFLPPSRKGGGWLGGLFGGGGGGGGPLVSAEEKTLLGIGSFSESGALERLDELTRLALSCTDTGGGDNDDSEESGEVVRAGVVGRVVGMVDVSRSELLLPSHSLDPKGSLYVCALSVAQNYRRLGLGAMLMKAVEDLAPGGTRNSGLLREVPSSPSSNGQLEGGGANGKGAPVRATALATPLQPSPAAPTPTTLWLHVEDASVAARALYDSLAFEPLAGRDLEKSHRGFTAALNLGPNSGAPANTLMRKELPSMFLGPPPLSPNSAQPIADTTPAAIV